MKLGPEIGFEARPCPGCGAQICGGRSTEGKPVELGPKVVMICAYCATVSRWGDEACEPFTAADLEEMEPHRREHLAQVQRTVLSIPEEIRARGRPPLS